MNSPRLLLRWASSLCLACLPLMAASQEEVPFITTPDRVTLAMLKLAQVGPQDQLLDLGSGDGRIVITAARHHGAKGTGVEIVPDLVQRSRESAVRAGVADRVRFLEQDLFKTDLKEATVITMYLLPEVNLQLRPLLLGLRPGTRIVSHDWDMGDWPPDRSLSLDVPEKAIGREKRSDIHLWWVPAPVAGLWCGPGGRSLRLEQSFQSVKGRWAEGKSSESAQGHVAGAQLAVQGLQGRMELRWVAPGLMRQTSASGTWKSKSKTADWRQLEAAQSCPAAG